MSRLMCKCGKIMGTSECPSPYKLNIYYDREVKNAIKDNPGILLIDFLTDWDALNECEKLYAKRGESVDYWYCPHCHRVYETQMQVGGHWLRVYQKQDSLKKDLPLEGWSEIYVLKDAETDAALEEKPYIQLSEYLKEHHDISYKLSLDEKYAAVFKDDKESCLYEIEENYKD